MVERARDEIDNNKSAFELIDNRKPFLSSIYTLGAECYVHDLVKQEKIDLRNLRSFLVK